MPIEPLAVSPVDAAKLLSVSRRTISNLIRSRKIAARKLGKRTLVDVESLKRFLATLPEITGPRLLFGERAHVRPSKPDAAKLEEMLEQSVNARKKKARRR